MRLLRAAAVAAMAAFGCVACDETSGTARSPAVPETPTNPSATAGSEGEFDFYVLSLSWSPSYCAAEGEDANRQQCGSARPYSFVVHGLWPQFERGYPQDCRVAERDVPRDLMVELYDIMPSSGLIRHQWRKHGSCSGLTQSEYFEVVRAARTRVTIPDEFRRLRESRIVDPDAVERAFLSANPGATAEGIAVTCDRNYLREVRICMTKALAFRACPEVDRRACRRETTAMPPVRGR